MDSIIVLSERCPNFRTQSWVFSIWLIRSKNTDMLSILFERSLHLRSKTGTNVTFDNLFIYKVTNAYLKFCERTFEG